jgi:hypothetical protein
VTITLPLDAPNRLWVFALDMAAQEVAALSRHDPAAVSAFNPIPTPAERPDPVAALLGVDALDPDFVEIFDLADLAGLGLSSYLATGNAIPEAQLAPDRARLDALQGPVLILFAAAFANRPVTLHPDPRLTLIGSYAEEIPPVEFEPLPDAGAKGSLGQPRSDALTSGHPASQTGTAQDAPPVQVQKYSNARMSGMVATAALLVMFAMVSLMIWIA